MNYRRATKEDIPKLVVLRIAYLKDQYHDVDENEYVQNTDLMTSYLEKHLDDDYIIFVAEQDEQIVASVFIKFPSQFWSPRDRYKEDALLMNVYTEAAFRKQGIAKKLLLMAIDYAKAIPLKYLTLYSTPPGYKLYKELGFKDREFEDTPMELLLKDEE